jgi:hypothetical protein
MYYVRSIYSITRLKSSDIDRVNCKQENNVLQKMFIKIMMK